MNQGYLLLVILLTLGLWLKNDALAVASTLLILLKLLKWETVFPKLEAYGLNVGVIVLTIGFLAPIAADKYSIQDIVQSMKTPLGICAVLGGLVVIFFTGRGYGLLKSDPAIIVPIVLGSILGIVAFNGVPVGPLIASGVTVFFYNIYKLIEKLFL